MTLKLGFQAFIVIVGFLMLSGGNQHSDRRRQWRFESRERRRRDDRLVSRAAQKVWNDLSHDQSDRNPPIGSDHRLARQHYTLGEAYAFGVIWSFAFKALAMLVLRFRDKSKREWKVPFNISLDGYEIPIGLGVITMLLFSVAGVNLITKEVATVSGIAFTIVFFTIFLVSER